MRADRDLLALRHLAGGKVTALVELAIIGQMYLWDDAEQTAAMNGQRTIVKTSSMAQRRADEDERQQSFGGANQPIDRAGKAVLHGPLEDKIIERVAGERQFREDRERHRFPMQSRKHADDSFGIGQRIGETAAGRAGRDAGKA